jgi:hypothetical protein
MAPAHGDTRFQGGLDHGSETLDALGDAAVDVAAAEGLAGSTKHHDLIGPIP